MFGGCWLISVVRWPSVDVCGLLFTVRWLSRVACLVFEVCWLLFVVNVVNVVNVVRCALSVAWCCFHLISVG